MPSRGPPSPLLSPALPLSLPSPFRIRTQTLAHTMGRNVRLERRGDHTPPKLPEIPRRVVVVVVVVVLTVL